MPRQPTEGDRRSHLLPTERLRIVLRGALETAQAQAHPLINTDDLLIALIDESDGFATKIFTNLGAGMNVIKAAVESHRLPQETYELTASPHLAPRAQYAMTLAEEEAQLGGGINVGTEHLLFGLLREKGRAAIALEACDVTLEKAREEHQRLMKLYRFGNPRR